MGAKMSSDLFKIYLLIIYLIYLYKQDLALNNLEGWICHNINQETKILLSTFVYDRVVTLGEINLFRLLLDDLHVLVSVSAVT